VNLDIAERIFTAIEEGDVDAVRDIYASEAVIWHNFDQVEQDVEENLQVLRSMVATFKERSYGDIRRSETADGFVQQHVLRLTRQDGTRVELPGCIIATCADGKITRIDEYLDSAQVARLVG